MKGYLLSLIGLSVIWSSSALCLDTNSHTAAWGPTLKEDLRQDFLTFYSQPFLQKSGLFLGTAGILANTGLDGVVRKEWPYSVHGRGSNTLSHIGEKVGSLCWIYLPIYTTGLLLGNATRDTLVGEPLFHWGYRSLRAGILGGVHQASLTYLLGSKRPSNGPSNWQPFHGSTGVSGHAFYGALPFISAASLQQSPWAKAVFYGLSTLSGLSRIHTEHHYASQVLLGWGLAYLSVAAVSEVERPKSPLWTLAVVPQKGGYQLQTTVYF